MKLLRTSALVCLLALSALAQVPPVRAPAPGTSGFVLTSAGPGNVPTWQSNPAGFPNPMTIQGDIIVAGPSGGAQRLASGTSGYALISTGPGSVPSWQALPSGFSNPMTTAGDLIIENAGGTPGRLAVGPFGYVLTSIGTGSVPTWQALPATLANPMNTQGDLIVGQTSGVPGRLAAGVNGYVMTSNGPGALPAWKVLPTTTASGPSITSGPYASLPGTCAVNDVYFFTTGNYSNARCTATNTWTAFWRGYAMTMPGSLSLASPSFNVGGFATNQTNGYESLALPAGAVNKYSGRTFTAPSTPYTTYLALNTPVFVDNGSYRNWAIGFAGSTGATVVLQCGVGVSYSTGFYCVVVNNDTTGSYAATVSGFTSPTLPQAFTGPTIVALTDDGTLLHWALCASKTSCTEIYNVSRTGYLSGGPTRLTYGLINSATGYTLNMDFLGTLQ